MLAKTNSTTTTKYLWSERFSAMAHCRLQLFVCQRSTAEDEMLILQASIVIDIIQIGGGPMDISRTSRPRSAWRRLTPRPATGSSTWAKTRHLRWGRDWSIFLSLICLSMTPIRSTFTKMSSMTRGSYARSLGTLRLFPIAKEYEEPFKTLDRCRTPRESLFYSF